MYLILTPQSKLFIVELKMPEVVGPGYHEVGEIKKEFEDQALTRQKLWAPEGPVWGCGIGKDQLPKGSGRFRLCVYLDREITPDTLKLLGLPTESYKGIPVRYQVTGPIVAAEPAGTGAATI